MNGTAHARIFATIALVSLSGLSSCAARQVQCKPEDRPAQQPAPPPLAYSQCMREIVDLGQGKRDRISEGCSILLRRAVTP